MLKGMNTIYIYNPHPPFPSVVIYIYIYIYKIQWLQQWDKGDLNYGSPLTVEWTMPLGSMTTFLRTKK